MAFTIAYRNELDDTERDAALAVARRMGASVTWQSDALSNRTYALVERAGVTAAAAFRAALHGTVHDAPIMALALYPSIPEALPSLVNALAGPGAPVGVIGCERCGDGLILEVDLDRTPIESVRALIEIELRRFHASARASLLSPLPLAWWTRIAAHGLGAPEIAPDRVLEALLESAHVE